MLLLPCILKERKEVVDLGLPPTSEPIPNKQLHASANTLQHCIRLYTNLCKEREAGLRCAWQTESDWTAETRILLLLVSMSVFVLLSHKYQPTVENQRGRNLSSFWLVECSQMQSGVYNGNNSREKNTNYDLFLQIGLVACYINEHIFYFSMFSPCHWCH